MPATPARAALVLFLLCAAASATGATRDPSRARSPAALLSRIASSRPASADPAFDCAWRLLALNYTSFIQPHLAPAQVQAVADALEIAALGCDAAAAAAAVAAHARARPPPRAPPRAAAAARTLYVDYAAGSDAAPGTLAAPLKTVAAAVAAARAGDPAATAVVLRGGTHYLGATVALGARDSGLAFAAFPGEAPVVSGAAPLPPLQWARVAPPAAARAPGPVLPGTNNVFGQCGRPGVPNKGPMASFAACQAACLADASCTSWTWNGPQIGDGFTNVCCWRTDGVWAPRAEAGTWSQNVTSAPPPPPVAAFSAPLPAAALPAAVAAGAMRALTLGGRRATLARFPNANAELDLFPAGFITAASWAAPAPGAVADETINVALPAGAEDAGAGMYINYTTGLGGNAARYAPPQSFWASAAFGPAGRWNEMHLRSPGGLDYGASLPRAPYADLSHAVVHSWRLHHWCARGRAQPRERARPHRPHRPPPCAQVLVDVRRAGAERDLGVGLLDRRAPGRRGLRRRG